MHGLAYLILYNYDVASVVVSMATPKHDGLKWDCPSLEFSLVVVWGSGLVIETLPTEYSSSSTNQMLAEMPLHAMRGMPRVA